MVRGGAYYPSWGVWVGWRRLEGVCEGGQCLLPRERYQRHHTTAEDNGTHHTKEKKYTIIYISQLFLLIAVSHCVSSPSLSLSLSVSLERGVGSDSDSCGESHDQRRTYKSRSVISSESDSDEEPSPADKKKTHPTKETKKAKGTALSQRNIFFVHHDIVKWYNLRYEFYVELKYPIAEIFVSMMI